MNVSNAARSKHSAFTLVELSIVLVILGLLVGGVLAGQSLIHAAELRAVTNEFGNYQIALNSFRDKYLGRPGDITNATGFWGVDAGGCNAANATTQTCNGNGDTIIGNTNWLEELQAWKQLANAGLIEGQFNGDTSYGPGSTPASKLHPAIWAFYYINDPVSSELLEYTGPVSLLVFGNAVAPTQAWGGVIKPEDAWNIDTKMDDGKPQSGSISNSVSGAESSPDCVAATNDSYNLTSQGNACPLLFLYK